MDYQLDYGAGAGGGLDTRYWLVTTLARPVTILVTNTTGTNTDVGLFQYGETSRTSNKTKTKTFPVNHEL